MDSETQTPGNGRIKKQKGTPIWKSIADILRSEIGEGIYRPNTKLPTEAELVDRFKVNRHTIRHSLSSLIEDGIVYSRQGSGAFVSPSPARYEIGQRVRFHQSIDNDGHQAAKKTLRIETRPATKDEAKNLKISRNALVHIYEGIGYVDDQPSAHFLSAYPAKTLPNFRDALTQYSSITKVFELCGIEDYMRAETRLTAVLANATTAMHLNLKSGAPLLRAHAINCDLNGKIIEYGRTWFSGNNIEMVIKNEAVIT